MNNYSEINKVFTRNSLKKLIDFGTSKSYEYCVEQFVNSGSPIKNIDIIKTLYSVLDKNYRNEYFYKNTLFNKLLLGKHSLNTSIAISELPIHRSKADFILINGNSEVFEIKTELDKIDRLFLQIEDYYKVFPLVSVLTSDTNYYKIYKLFKESNIGIKVLTSRNTISIKKTPIPNYEKLDPTSMFKVLRKTEFEYIITKKFGYLPQVNQFDYYKECKKIFSTIPTKELQNEVNCVLKKRVLINNELFNNIIPMELKSLAYFSSLSNNDLLKMDNFLQSEWR
ncbi:sce7726 family protein [Bacillus safensis]|uniref:sce7726 family protein n=1 Tax=Bacillus TaxID=1386 RepID=UPI001BCDE3D1|nr:MULTISPECIES: sce7726 family protein [Bacillus]MBS4746138.1 sce7726 family protein [Bacillus altitudinis]MEE3679341.1 sce7726 family protein [Bacillus safensis]WMT28617.1 sce7726 family protein [Bacillus aerius]